MNLLSDALLPIYEQTFAMGSYLDNFMEELLMVNVKVNCQGHMIFKISNIDSINPLYNDR